MIDSILSSYNATYIAELYNRYKKNPQSVPEHWGDFFDAMGDSLEDVINDYAGASWHNAQTKVLDVEDDSVQSSQKLSNDVLKLSLSTMMLIEAYRKYGYTLASYDPLGLKKPKRRPDLLPEFYGIKESDLKKTVSVLFMDNKAVQMSIADIISTLDKIYTGEFGIEYGHVDNEEALSWLRNKIELGIPNYKTDELKQFYDDIIKGESFEKFFSVKFPGEKRFGSDGTESQMVFVEQLLRTASKNGVRDTVIGMAHRGRLSILVNTAGRPFDSLMAEFNGEKPIPEELNKAGDVKYHNGYSSVRKIEGNDVSVTLLYNPSHLEAIVPFVLGSVRAKQDRTENKNSIMPLTIHGDSSIVGLGVIQETLGLERLEGYKVYGTIHLVTNNQVGFTAEAGIDYIENPGSVGRMISAPIIHVNADNVVAVAYAAEIAAEYRQKFGLDVFVNLVGYRRFGHNEGDEPRFTQPIMYKASDAHPGILKKYQDFLIKKGVFNSEEAQKIVSDYQKSLQASVDNSKNIKLKADWLEGRWNFITTKSQADIFAVVKTGVEKTVLEKLASNLTKVPEGFNINPKIARVFEERKASFSSGENIDWAGAELLAYASLLNEGTSVRLSGEDSKRGTFSHRHAEIVDQNNNSRYNMLSPFMQKAQFNVYNSTISEFGVLGFDAGYSMSSPDKLTIWEAQYGDFANGGQVIYDQFLSSGEEKWLRLYPLVMLLPHGLEGQGPEHSSARIERFLQLCSQDNWFVCYPTTPANFFHLLRRQIHAKYRKPLVIFSPKSPLRNKLVVSSLKDMSGNTTFNTVLDDDVKDKKSVKRLLIGTGKIYWDIYAKRSANNQKDVAMIRIEQLYPFPRKEIQKIVDSYPKDVEIAWIQEENANMGGYTYALQRLMGLLGRNISYVGRPSKASPAIGFNAKHVIEQSKLIDTALNTKAELVNNPFDND